MKPAFLIIGFSYFIFSCKNNETDKKTNSQPLANVQEIVGIGRVEPENEIIQLSTEVGGIVEKIYKNENDRVQAGDTIFELKHTIEDANIAQLNSAVAIQKAQIYVDESAIKELQIKYENSSTELQRLKNLLAKGAETKQVVDNATAEMETFQANRIKLQATVAVSKLKWQETKAQVAIEQVHLKQKFITAPISGVLLEINIQLGNYIDSKEVIVQLNPEGKTIAVCEIDELFANKIRIGQTAIIRNFGALDTLSIGNVNFVSSFLKKKSLFTDQSGEKIDRRVREIKIVLDNPANVLLNSRVECVVFISKTNP